MVYLDLSVKSMADTVDFYCEKLGIFKAQAGQRLICNIDIDLIIDLREIGTQRHKDTFNQDSHVMASFCISSNDDEHDDDYEIEILERLKIHAVKYRETGNLGGHYLRFIDPSGNKFTLHARHGILV